VNAILDRSADLDSAIMGVAIDPDLGPLDLLTIYLPGLDIAQHTLFANAATLSPAEISERIAALDHYYEMLDRIVNRVAYVPTEGLNPPNPYPNTTVILVTQGGRVSQPSPGIVTVYAGVVHDRVEPGRLRDALADATPVTNASRMSVAGTVLYALGVPVADDLGSPPLLSLFGPAFVAAHPLRTVATYGTRSSMARRAGGNTLDQEMIDRMRSLGYLK
jgi:hypothetical protein